MHIYLTQNHCSSPTQYSSPFLSLLPPFPHPTSPFPFASSSIHSYMPWHVKWINPSHLIPSRPIPSHQIEFKSIKLDQITLFLHTVPSAASDSCSPHHLSGLTKLHVCVYAWKQTRASVCMCKCMYVHVSVECVSTDLCICSLKMHVCLNYEHSYKC